MTNALPARTVLEKWHRTSWADRGVLCEAMLLLAICWPAILLLPFRALARSASWGRTGRVVAPGEQLAILRRVRWAVQACAARVPWRAVCYHRALAAQWMLRRRGIASTLHYGAAMGGEKGLAVHVWVTAGDFDVVGGEVSRQFAVLASFPASPRCGTL